jgi:type I restriction enzyme S subunit
VKGSVYGSAVKHIEPHHLADLPVPRFDSDLEIRIHELVEASAQLRAAFQSGLEHATEDFFRNVGLPELATYRWHDEGRDLGFGARDFGPSTIRALNLAPRRR